MVVFFVFQAEDGIRDLVRSRGLGDVYKRQGFYRDMRVLEIAQEQILPFNKDGRLFQNLNTPRDVDEAQNKS